METALKRLYEGMFLIDSAQASDWDGVVKTIKKLLDRSDAEIVTIRNWAERKLAYEIDHKSRGTYVLCFFKADADKIRNIEKDVQLSEQIMRVLILGTETRDKAEVEQDMHGLKEEKETPKTEEAGAEQVSSEQQVEEAVEPEESDSPVAADTSEPEETPEAAAADVTEPEKPAEAEVVDVTEPEQPTEPAVAEATETEKPAEAEAAEATEPEQPETEQEPKKPEKKRFFNW